MYYTLEYLNKAGDTVARDYFDNLQKAIDFMDHLIETYKKEGSETGLFLTDSNDNVVTYYIH